jgi:hypothetical protein
MRPGRWQEWASVMEGANTIWESNIVLSPPNVQLTCNPFYATQLRLVSPTTNQHDRKASATAILRRKYMQLSNLSSAS